jgi:hypothetical protein
MIKCSCIWQRLIMAGRILCSTGNALPDTSAEDRPGSAEDMIDGDEEVADKQEVLAMDELATFDRVVTWYHGPSTEEVEDPYAKALQEWTSLAAKVRAWGNI